MAVVSGLQTDHWPLITHHCSHSSAVRLYCLVARALRARVLASISDASGCALRYQISQPLPVLNTDHCTTDH